MKAKLKHLLISVKTLKVGYVVMHNDLFGVISEINDNIATIVYTDNTTEEVDKNLLISSVVKFIAVMRDFKSYAIVHGDFSYIISYFDTKEKVQAYITKDNATVEGLIKSVYTYPKVEDVVQLVNMQMLEKHKFMLNDKLERIGIITDITNNIATIKFPNITLTAKKSSFEILNGVETKSVFEVEK